MTYALLTQHMDHDEQQKFDAELNGYAERDRRAVADLLGMSADRGER